MALHKHDDDATSKKISKLKKEGKSQKQAVAQGIVMTKGKKKPATTKKKKKSGKSNFFERFNK